MPEAECTQFSKVRDLRLKFTDTADPTEYPVLYERLEGEKIHTLVIKHPNNQMSRFSFDSSQLVMPYKVGNGRLAVRVLFQVGREAEVSYEIVS